MIRRAVALALLFAMLPGVAAAGRGPSPSCSVSDNVLTAINLPVGEPIRVSSSTVPGQGEFVTDGTLVLTLNPDYWVAPFTVYIVQRGHGPSLVKMPAQLGDYHVIAMCPS